MEGAWLYKINYEEYKKHEQETDERLAELSHEKNKENGLISAYLIRVNTEFPTRDEIYGNYYVLVGGDKNYSHEAVEQVVFGLDDRYPAYKEAKTKYTTRRKEMTEDDFECLVNSEQNVFVFYELTDFDGDLDYLIGQVKEQGNFIKKVF